MLTEIGDNPLQVLNTDKTFSELDVGGVAFVFPKFGIMDVISPVVLDSVWYETRLAVKRNIC